MTLLSFRKMPHFFMALTIVLSNNLNAATRYVNASASGSNNGTSWTNAYTTLDLALSSASSGDEIWVAAGTYYPGATRSSTFTIPSGVKVYGGFAGTENLLTQRNWRINVCILSGDIGVVGINTDNCYHVVKFNGVNSTTTIDGFTITKGYADGSSPDNSGGGILNLGTASGSSPIIENCIIEDNYASSDGGGIMSNSNGSGNTASIIISKSAIRGNKSNHNGGGIEIYAWTGTSTATISNCQITGNRTVNSGGGIEFGAGYSPASITGTVVFCTIAGNYTFAGGSTSGNGINVQVQTGTLAVNVKNCIAYGNGSSYAAAYEIQRNTPTGSITVSYSDIKDCTTTNWYTNSNCIDGGNNINSDPSFVSSLLYSNAPSTSGNFAINTGSPCIGAGLTDNNYPKDLSGATRPTPPALGCFEPGSTLPVTWLTFSGKIVHGQAQLDWATASEQNSSHFEVEKSTDGINFNYIGQVRAARNSTTKKDYQFIDPSLLQGAAYYRLKQTDLDGKYSYSSIILLNRSTTTTIKSWAAPGSGNLTIEIPQANNSVAECQIYDLTGRLIFKKQVLPGRNFIDMKRYAGSAYLVTIFRNGAVIHNNRFIN